MLTLNYDGDSDDDDDGDDSDLLSTDKVQA